MDSIPEDFGSTPKQYSVHEKLKLSLFKLLDIDYDVTDDSILSKLSSFLVDLNRGKNSLGVNLYESIYEEWLTACITHWKNGALKPTIAVFAVQVLSIICQDPAYFAVLNSGEKSILSQFQELIVSKLATNPLFPISYAKLLASCISHKEGLAYVLERDLWKQVLSIYVWDESMFVKKECKDFLVPLCANVCEKNLDHASKILAQIFELYELYCKNNSIYTQKTINKKFTQILNLLISILETFLTKQEFGIANKYFISRPDFCESLWSNLSTSHSDEILVKISKLLILSKLMSFTPSESLDCADGRIIFFEGFLLKILQKFLDKDSLREISLLCELTVKYCKFNEVFVQNPSLLENLLAIRLIPFLAEVEKQHLIGDSISDHSNFKSLKSLNLALWESVLNFGVQYKQSLNGHSNLAQIAVCCITALDSEFEVPSTHYRLLIFNALASLFKEYFVPKNSSDLSNTDFINSRLTSAFLALLKSSVVKSTEILSRQVEVYEMLPSLVVFLSVPGQSPAVSTLALNFVRQILEILPENANVKIISIIKSVTPDLQKVLLKFMYSVSWEVRDSAIEVLSCIADLSLKRVKFDESVISLQLANDVFSVFTSDNEYYVRATALACLCKLVEVDDIWSRMDQEGVLRKLLEALKTEDEAIVRRQIPLLLKQIHRFSDFSDAILTETLYPALVRCSMKDLHWEVCVNALDFWQFVIMKYLKVPATDMSVPDIRSFFVKQLTFLNNLGCFQVLIKCLQSEADLEVSKKAAEILCELSAHLNKFLTSDSQQRVDLCHSLVVQSNENSTECFSDTSTKKCEESDLPEAGGGTDFKTSDKVIDAIVDATDISLLAGVYNVPASNSAEPLPKSCDASDGTVLTETELIDMFTKINVAELIENKIEFFRQSQNNLESLLNDILLPGFNNSQNPTLDCY